MELEDVKKLLRSGSGQSQNKNSKANKKKTPSFQSTILELLFIVKFIAPIIWPRKNSRLKILIIISGFTLIANGVVNFFVPIYAQNIVNSMAPSSDVRKNNSDELEFRWDLILVFIALKVFQGIGALSLITLMQQMLWLPIEHHARHEIQVKFFKHLHNMSLTWMMHAKTGDILGALERGTESIASSLEHLIYSVAPTIFDILIAISYLAWRFGWMYGIIVGTQITFYLIFTIYAIEKRSQFQGAINRGEDDLNQNVLESMTNFETVKCFGNEEFEKEKYSKSLKRLQYQQFLIAAITGGMQFFQLVVIYSGLMACSMLLVWSVIHDSRFTAGDYVLCTSFLVQLYAPLNYLGQYYKELRVNLINAKSMLYYFVEAPEIRDSEYASDLSVKDGLVEFRNVSYVGENGTKVLDNVSFTVAPKTTLALVGPSGAGKSSIVRLLFRLLDATSGEVLVEEENVKDVKVKSLREILSIVPQDTTLFNDTIRSNIKYGKLDATNYEVVLAATAARLHEKIMSFPDGYDTIVGERGARLSGGERQRVAIARAILKDPKILIFDEATSALDSKTEREIQESLNLLCKNRTCIMITHKLSNTVDADNILVLKEGRIVDTGSHSALLSRNGLYASMWKQQNKSTCEVIEDESNNEFLEGDRKSNRVL